MNRFVKLFIICLFGISFLAVSFGNDKAALEFIVKNNPVKKTPQIQQAPETFYQQSNELALIGASLVRAYQVFISPQDIPSCPFNPTDSEYAKQAISKYGLIAGIIMASDRYQRCNGFGTWYYPREEKTGRLIDPVEHNHP